MFNNCSKCGDLWREFADATAEHLAVANRLKRAVLESDYEAIRALREQEQVAFDRKAKLRDAIRKHDTDVHGIMARTF
jgi:hypothetical protein